MPFASFEGEARISQLVDRLFTVPAGSPPALRRSVEKALREANPQLTDLQNVPAGAPILVPEVPGVQLAPAVAAPSPAAALVVGLAGTVTAAQRSLTEGLRRDAAERDRIVDLLKLPELREQAQEDPALREQIERVAAAADDRLAARQAQAERRERTLAALNADLEELARNPGALPSALTPGAPQ
jgi:hypothetical protein